MILSFELPFALVPLLKFSGSNTKMGPHKNSILIIIISWLLGLMTIGINVYFLSTSFVDWLIKSTLPKFGRVLVGIIVFPLMAMYILAIIYLTFRKDTVVTFTPASESTQIEMEKGVHQCNDDGENEPVPYREDLADIPFSE